MSLPPASLIRWGPQLTNILSFEHPTVLDGPRTWHLPGPGSEQVRNPNGVTDGWRTGTDYFLAGRARWFDPTRYGSLQAFLDWAGDGNAFEFIPDSRVPDWSIANCYLDRPFDGWEPDLETADFSQSADIVIRTQTMDLGLALRGLALEITPDYAFDATTFDRTGDAWQQGGPGDMVLRKVTTDIARGGHYVNGRRTLLIEPYPVDNRMPRSQNLEVWTQVDPSDVFAARWQLFLRGELKLDHIAKTASGTHPYKAHSIALPGGANHAHVVSVHTAKGTTTGVDHLIIWADNTAGVNRLSAEWTWNADGTIGTISPLIGTHLKTQDLGGGLYRLWFQTTAGVVAANANEMRVYPVSTNESTSVIAEVYVGGIQVDFFPWATSYIHNNTAAALQRNGETPSIALPFATPRPLAIYTKLILQQEWQGTDTFARIWDIGANFPNKGNLMIVWNNSADFEPGWFSDDNYGGNGGGIDLDGLYGDVLEFLLELDPLGRVRLTGRKNGGAIVVGSFSAIFGFGTRVWGGTGKLHLGSANGSSRAAGLGFESLKIAPLHTGLTVTLDQMAAA